MVREGDSYFIVALDSTYRNGAGGPTINVATRTDGLLPFLADFIAGRLGNTELITTTAVIPDKK